VAAVRAKAKLYRERFNTPLTPQALTGNWNLLSQPVPLGNGHRPIPAGEAELEKQAAARRAREVYSS
jgi:hypothetical protein